METTPLTELAAVNIILDNDGESPVASLDETGFGDVARAQRTLQEISRVVQTKGWAFNTDENRKFTPDVDDEITLPTDTLWVKPVYTSATMNVVERGRKLYDRSTGTYTFTQPLYLDICQMLDFPDLPASARDYITIRAARVFQSRGTGSGQQNSFTQQDEALAQATFRQADNRSKPRGFFRNPANARVLTRRPL